MMAKTAMPKRLRWVVTLLAVIVAAVAVTQAGAVPATTPFGLEANAGKVVPPGLYTAAELSARGVKVPNLPAQLGLPRCGTPAAEKRATPENFKNVVAACAIAPDEATYGFGQPSVPADMASRRPKRTLAHPGPCVAGTPNCHHYVGYRRGCEEIGGWRYAGIQATLRGSNPAIPIPYPGNAYQHTYHRLAMIWCEAAGQPALEVGAFDSTNTWVWNGPTTCMNTLAWAPGWDYYYHHAGVPCFFAAINSGQGGTVYPNGIGKLPSNAIRKVALDHGPGYMLAYVADPTNSYWVTVASHTGMACWDGAVNRCAANNMWEFANGTNVHPFMSDGVKPLIYGTLVRIGVLWYGWQAGYGGPPLPVEASPYFYCQATQATEYKVRYSGGNC